MTRRFRAVIAYDGARYHGFQRLTGAASAPTVQGALEAALLRVSGAATSVMGAGRTDAGVHATGQVIAFDSDWRHSDADLLRALNATLPEDIVVQRLDVAAPDFHPRYDALRRAYVYRVYQSPVRQPLLDKTAWWVRGDPALALDQMNAAAARLVGTHDFASFGTPPRGDKGTTRRTVVESVWLDEPAPLHVAGTARLLAYRIEADAFLYRMVRAVAATLIEVGRGRLALDGFEAAFQARDRAAVRHLAPAHGLTLIAVHYPSSSETTRAGRRPLEHDNDEVQDLHTHNRDS
ncbi:MAG: tRNA pseudouridine(38-40) synthase TruA [Anaerolineae bacterium]|nr:tRNA pseudouridine(38-40) synthase TruA [Anaerolineae bacterium]